MNLFLDTSAFAKRYVAEAGSEKVLSLCANADRLSVSALCLPEFVSTLSRLAREAKMSKANYRLLKGRALADLAEADVVAIDAAVIAQSVSLLESYPLRTLDALHVASALAIDVTTGATKFVSADQRQLSAARQAGLNVVSVV